MPPKATKTSTTPPALPPDDEAFVRLPTVLVVYPVGATTWHEGVAQGRYPRGHLLGPRVRAWRVGDIRQLLTATTAEPR